MRGGESVSGDTVQKVTNIEKTKTLAKTAGSVDRSSKDFWDKENEVSLHKDGVTYHAYLSKDKTESWIYQADNRHGWKRIILLTGKKMRTNIFAAYVKETHLSVKKSRRPWRICWNKAAHR